ncbi:MAG: uncharacterized protein JWQ48_971 [Conexibacter sp.]|jgi:predicted ester cyclase|nr:uncharacterized protein [Conexibacter sp.]
MTDQGREASLELLARFTDEWLNGHDREALDQICHPDIAYHWGALGDGRGVDGLAALEEAARVAFPDMRVQTDWVLADGDHVARRSIVTGTHRGAWFGIAPTGRRATWAAMEGYRIRDGRIAVQWLVDDWASALSQGGRLSPIG